MHSRQVKAAASPRGTFHRPPLLLRPFRTTLFLFLYLRFFVLLLFSLFLVLSLLLPLFHSQVSLLFSLYALLLAFLLFSTRFFIFHSFFFNTILPPFFRFPSLFSFPFSLIYSSPSIFLFVSNSFYYSARLHFSYFFSSTSVSHRIFSQFVCLPSYPTLTLSQPPKPVRFLRNGNNRNSIPAGIRNEGTGYRE